MFCLLPGCSDDDEPEFDTRDPVEYPPRSELPPFSGAGGSADDGGRGGSEGSAGATGDGGSGAGGAAGEGGAGGEGGEGGAAGAGGAGGQAAGGAGGDGGLAAGGAGGTGGDGGAGGLGDACVAGDDCARVVALQTCDPCPVAVARTRLGDQACLVAYEDGFSLLAYARPDCTAGCADAICQDAAEGVECRGGICALR